MYKGNNYIYSLKGLSSIVQNKTCMEGSVQKSSYRHKVESCFFRIVESLYKYSVKVKRIVSRYKGGYGVTGK